jgi:hypothetical protein
MEREREVVAPSGFGLAASFGAPLFGLAASFGAPLFGLAASLGALLFGLAASLGALLFGLAASLGAPLFAPLPLLLLQGVVARSKSPSYELRPSARVSVITRIPLHGPVRFLPLLLLPVPGLLAPHRNHAACRQPPKPRPGLLR